MTRQLCLLMTLVLLTGTAVGRVHVSEGYEPATMPRVALCGDQYFVVWVWETSVGRQEIWAARNPLGVPERFRVYRGDLDPIVNIEIAAKGDVVLVVFEEVSVEDGHRIEGRLVQPNNSIVALQGPISEHNSPAVASYDDHYLVAYHEDEGDLISGREVYDNGDLGEPFLIAQAGYLPSLASDGQRLLLVYCLWDPPNPGVVLGKEVGSIEDPFPIIEGEDPDFYDTDVAYDDGRGRFLVASLDPVHVKTRQCLLDQALGECQVIPSVAGPEGIAVAASDINYMVVFGYDLVFNTCIGGQRINQVGDMVGHNVEVRRADRWKSDPHVASDGLYYGVVWCEEDEPPNEDNTSVLIDTVCSYQRHFYVENTEATAGNGARHLALDPVTGWLHRVYQRKGGPAVEDSVFYTWSTDSGANWHPSEFVGEGSHPCVVCVDQPNNHVWVCYRPSMCSLRCRIRLGLGDWREHDIASPTDDITEAAPSISPIFAYSVPADPGVYIGHRIGPEYAQPQRIVFNAVWLNAGVGPRETVHWAREEVQEYLYAPSVATTPLGGTDVVHCAWASSYEDEILDRVYYRRRLYGVWLPPPPELPEDVSGQNQEPASRPSADAYGDKFYAIWTGDHDQDVWRRWRLVEVWWGPEPDDPISPVGPDPSFDGQGSLGEITAVWTELTPPHTKVMLRVGNAWHVMRDPGPEVDLGNAHIATAFVDNPNADSVMVFATWTERRELGLEPPYEVMFGCSKYHLDMQDAGPGLAFYDCGVGDSIQSRYCLERDGYARWRGFSVDYGRQSLRYRLPYLNPHCVYRLRAVLYQASKDVWEQSFTLDSLPQGKYRLKPLQPETVWVTIPRVLYQRDFEAVLDISRISGDYAAVAELKVYELYPFMVRKGGWGPDLSLSESGAEPQLRDAGANPFRRQACIAYSIPRVQQASVRVYDVQGRVVRELASGLHQPGEHLLTWDGRDALGRRVAAGTYFTELRTDSSAQTRKLVYAP